MAARTGTGEASAFNAYRLSAAATQIASWVTTYWFCVWVMPPQTDAANWTIIGISIVFEWLLVQLKRLLFDKKKGAEAFGWMGVVVDTILNAGGLFDKAGRILTFPPVAAILLFAQINVYNTTVNQIGAFMVAVLVGYGLSVAPLKLWNAGKPK